jgi:hypothetical protein
MNAGARAQAVLAGVAMVSGALGVVRAGGSLTNRSGSDIGYGDLELHLMSFNRLGGLLALALGTLALAGALQGRRVVVAAAAFGFVVFALQTLIGDRRIDGGNITGANGATLSFCLMMAIGLGVLAWYERPNAVAT